MMCRGSRGILHWCGTTAVGAAVPFDGLMGSWVCTESWRVHGAIGRGSSSFRNCRWRGVLRSEGSLAFMVVCSFVISSFSSFPFVFAFRCGDTQPLESSTQAPPVQ